MTEARFFELLPDEYHDGCLENILFQNQTLYMYCFRCPADFGDYGDDDDNPNKDYIIPTNDPDTRYIIIRFDNVTELQLYDWGKKTYLPYNSDSLTPNYIDTIERGIDYLDYTENGFVEFAECLRFRCEDLEVIAHSSEELDFFKYVKID